MNDNWVEWQLKDIEFITRYKEIRDNDREGKFYPEDLIVNGVIKTVKQRFEFKTTHQKPRNYHESEEEIQEINDFEQILIDRIKKAR